jgi:hypothetical protein
MLKISTDVLKKVYPNQGQQWFQKAPLAPQGNRELKKYKTRPNKVIEVEKYSLKVY